MNTQKITNFLFEIATLRRLTRSHRQMIETVSDNISDHSFRVAVIGMVLAKIEGVDEDKVLKICLFHDLVEARTGDANWINQQYVKNNEEKAREEQMKGLPIEGEVLGLMKEYEERKTREAILAKDADLLDQMILQQEYFYKDKENGNKWQNYTERQIKTETAKKIAEKIRQSNPFEWLYQLSEEKTGER